MNTTHTNICIYSTPTLTQGFYSLFLLGAGFITELAADVVEGEENMMLLMNMDWQLNFNLHKKTFMS